MAGGAATTRDAGNDILENVFKKIELLPDELTIKNYLEKQLQMDTIEPQGAEGCREDKPIKKRTEDSRGKKEKKKSSLRQKLLELERRERAAKEAEERKHDTVASTELCRRRCEVATTMVICTLTYTHQSLEEVILTVVILARHHVAFLNTTSTQQAIAMDGAWNQ